MTALKLLVFLVAAMVMGAGEMMVICIVFPRAREWMLKHGSGEIATILFVLSLGVLLVFSW